jgi:hypothetical protein
LKSCGVFLKAGDTSSVVRAFLQRECPAGRQSGGASSLAKFAESSVAGVQQSTGDHYGQGNEKSEKRNQETEKGEAKDFARSPAERFLTGRSATNRCGNG